MGSFPGISDKFGTSSHPQRQWMTVRQSMKMKRYFFMGALLRYYHVNLFVLITWYHKIHKMSILTFFWKEKAQAKSPALAVGVWWCQRGVPPVISDKFGTSSHPHRQRMTAVQRAKIKKYFFIESLLSLMNFWLCALSVFYHKTEGLSMMAGKPISMPRG